MIKVILMDCDGPVIKREKYFSQRLLDLGMKLDVQKIQDFFHNEFLLCETGKADLKQELGGRIGAWGWEKPLDELLDFWFSGEAFADPKMTESVKKIKEKGTECYLTTDQEKYRTEYLREVVGLNQYFDRIYSSCDVGFLKRQAEFWNKIYGDLKEYSKEEILVWDDDNNCIAAAKKFGFNAEHYENFEKFKNVVEERYKIVV
jgi:FMN phosphatase YigB (HAD superfamily)